jgi:DNA polymerase I
MTEAIKTKRKKLAIIDGKSVFYRGYYAMPNLSTKDGKPTGGVFGFASMALEVLKRLKPDYVAVAWDKPKTNIRKRLAMYPEYKAGRKPAPPDFYEQIPVLQELLEAFGWPLYELDDYEADDIMGTLAVKASKKDIETMLITSDLDVLQLVDEHVHAFTLKKGLSNIELYSPESFKAKYGIEATQHLDLKALKGDSSDNIPGVPGIGEKTAIELLKEYKTLDGVYDNLDLLKESVRKKLEAGKDLAYLSKKIGAIWTDAPIDLDLENLDVTKCDPAKIRDILHRLEFRSLVRQLPEAMQWVPEEGAAIAHAADLPLGKAVLIDSDSALDAWEAPKQKEAIIYTQSAEKHGRKPQVLILSYDPKTVYIFDLPKLKAATLVSKLQTLDSVVGYDVKNSLKVFIELGVELPAVGHDVLIGAFMLNSLRREQSLTELAESDIAYEGSPFEELPPEDVMARASELVAVLGALHKEQAKEFEKLPSLVKLAADIEWPVIPVLARMEYEGIYLNTDYLEKFSKEIEDTISDLEQKIYGMANEEFNIGSPAQLAEVLFTKMKLPTMGIKKGKTGYSTAASELDKLRSQHKIIDLITQYREVTKLKNTYIDALPKLVDSNSRVHTTFALTVAQTGRLSSNDPNLQNIPVRTDLGKRIRTAFEAGKGNVLISADYSQFELRLAAVLAKDKDMIDTFNRGVDIHTQTAAEVYGRELEDVTKQMRSAAKTVNFGVLYGMSPHGLSAATGMTFAQAKEFIDKYFEHRAPLVKYLAGLKKQALEDGYVETMFGRRRPMPDIKSSNFVVRQAAERQAINMPIQGTEADLMKMAMIEVDKKLVGTKSKQLLQIHDSILIESPESEAKDIEKMLKDVMEHVYKLPVNLDVDVSQGKNWGAL